MRGDQALLLQVRLEVGMGPIHLKEPVRRLRLIAQLATRPSPLLPPLPSPAHQPTATPLVNPLNLVLSPYPRARSPRPLPRALRIA